MAEKDKKYYWLKLTRGFFKRHDMLIIENMPNGKDYILFYLKLLCESVDHDGNLRFSEEIPYNEEMLSSLTNTNIDIVRSAVKLFTGLHMMELMDDGTYYMRQVEKMIGSETYWAQKKREQRELENKSIGHCPTIVQQLSNDCPTCPSKRIDKDIDKDLDKEKEEIINKSSIESIFDQMMKELEKVIAPITFITFFKDKLKWLDIKGNRLILTAPSFMASVIDEKYRSELKEAISKASEGRLTGYELEGE